MSVLVPLTEAQMIVVAVCVAFVVGSVVGAFVGVRLFIVGMATSELWDRRDD